MPARSLLDALSASSAAPLLARLKERQQLAHSLAEAVARVAPDFDARDPRAFELREGVLLLHAASAGQAAKLRQSVPGLLRLLHLRGNQVTEIRVKVQPERMSYPERANDPAQGSPRADGADVGARPADERPPLPPPDAGPGQFAEGLAAELPDSPLREAARRLQRALARRGR